MKTAEYHPEDIHPPYIQISLRTKLNMRDMRFGRKIAEILWKAEPSFQPTEIGLNFENENPCRTIDDILNKWCVLYSQTHDGIDYAFPKRIHWKNSINPKFQGSFSHKFTATSGTEVSGGMMVTFSFIETVNWKTMFLSLCALMKPQLAMMHLFTYENCPPNKRDNRFQTGHFSGLSDPQIPGLGWMFAAGDEYYTKIAGFDLEGVDVSRKNFGSYCTLEIAKNADEIINESGHFEGRKERLLKVFPLPVEEDVDSLLDD